MRQPTIAVKDNGYFEIWNLPCGHQVRVTTEHYQWQKKTERGFTTRVHERERARLSRPGICPACNRAADEN